MARARRWALSTGKPISHRGHVHARCPNGRSAAASGCCRCRPILITTSLCSFLRCLYRCALALSSPRHLHMWPQIEHAHTVHSCPPMSFGGLLVLAALVLVVLALLVEHLSGNVTEVPAAVLVLLVLDAPLDARVPSLDLGLFIPCVSLSSAARCPPSRCASAVLRLLRVVVVAG